MRFLKKRDKYFFDRIDESMFYMSPDMREILKELANKKGNKIAKELLEVEFTDVKPDITFVDKSDKEGYITFTQIKKADKLINKMFHDEDGDQSIDVVKGEFISTDGDIDKSWVNWIYNLDTGQLTGNPLASGVFTKGRNQVKIGKLVNKIFPGKFKDKEVEEFVNLFKAKSSEEEGEKFELVSGEEIDYWYNCESHAGDTGTLGNSCMRHGNDYFGIYKNNPDVCRLLILKDENDKLLGRALVWKPDVTSSNGMPDIKYFMDRVYTINDSDVNKFYDFAEEKGWARKEYNNFSSHNNVHFGGEDYIVDMEVQVNKPKGNKHSYEYQNYPYMDTFTEYDEDEGILYNNDNSEHGGIILNDIDGGYQSAGYWSDYHGETVPEDESVWAEHMDDFILSDRSVYINYGSMEGWWPIDHDDIIFENWLDEYVHISDTVYSDYHGEVIFIDNAVEIITGIDEDGTVISSDWFHEDDNTAGADYLYVSFDELESNDEVDREWLERFDDEWGWRDDYAGISSELLSEDYRGNFILEINEVTTYPIEGGEWLTYEDAIMLGKKLTGEDDDHRDEDKYEYFKRVWIDSNRNVFKAIEDAKEKLKKWDRILDGEDLQLDLDDKDEYMKKIRNLYPKISDHIEDLGRNWIDDMYEIYPEELSKDKVEVIYGYLPDDPDKLEEDLLNIRKEFLEKWLNGELPGSKDVFERLMTFYESQFKDYTEEELKDSFRLYYLYVVPARESKELSFDKGSITNFLEQKLGRDIDFDKEVKPGYLMLRNHFEAKPQRYNSSNINNLLSMYKDYMYLKRYADNLKEDKNSQSGKVRFDTKLGKYVKVEENINKYNMSHLRKFNEYQSFDGNLKVNDYMTRKWMAYGKFKYQNILNFGKILKSIYEPMGHWQQRQKGGGVVGLSWDDENWSILNRINTNYTALAIIINEANKFIEENNISIPKFDFINNKFPSEAFFKEYQRMIDFLMAYKEELFKKTSQSDGSELINKVVNTIRRTKSIGDDAEKLVVKYLPKLNSDITNIRLPEGSGDETDMLGGADVIFEYNGKDYTIQVKKVRFTKKEGGEYIAKGSSIAKNYKTTYYAIVDKYFVRFFKNDPNKIEISFGGEISFDQSLLSGEFQYKKFPKRK